MSSIASKNVTSPDLSLLGYSILYDISGATPTITITNHSTVTDDSALTWWYAIQMPDGTYLHQGSVDNPDVDGISWTTIVVPDVWPTPFGTPPYAQVEFSCSIPYIFTLYVQDSTPTTFNLGTPTTLCRPNGSTTDTPGNFGKADVSIKTMFETAQIRGIDTTDYTYQNLLGTSQTNKWTLVYPFDNNNIRPSDRTAIDTATVLFPIGFTGDGYQIAFQSYSLYDFSNGSAAKIQYKFTKVFAVWLNVDLVTLRCEMDKLFRETIKSCGTVSNPDAINKLSQANYLYTKVFEGIIYPLNCVNVPATIAEIQRLCGFTCNCFCVEGINAGVMPPASSGGTIQVPIFAYGTDAPPTNCPNSYFPVNVLNPAGDAIIGFAYGVDDVVAIINASNEWLAYGVWFAQGNCLLGLYPLQLATTVPPLQVDYAVDATVIGNEQNYILPIVTNCGVGAVTAESFPYSGSTVNFGASDIVLTTPINSLASYLSILNAAAIANSFSNITFTASTIAYPLYIIVHNSSATTSTPTVVLETCPTAPTVTENLQTVTNGSGNNITTNPIIAGSVGSNISVVSNTTVAVYNNAGAAIKSAIGTDGSNNGILALGNSANANLIRITAPTATGARTAALQDGNGTLAFLSDIVTGTLQTVTDGSGNNETTNDLVVKSGTQKTTQSIDSFVVGDAGGTTDIAQLRTSGMGNTGILVLRQGADITKSVEISSEPLTADRNITTPDNDGIVALVGDIPVGLEGITTGTGNNITGHSLVVAIATQKTQQTSFSMDVYNAAGAAILARIFNSAGTGQLFLSTSTGSATITPSPSDTVARTLTLPPTGGELIVGARGTTTLVSGQKLISAASIRANSAFSASYVTPSGPIGVRWKIVSIVAGIEMTIASIDTSGAVVTTDNSVISYLIT